MQGHSLLARGSAMAKVRRRLIPFLILCYFSAYLDRVNIGFAALRMNEDLGIGPEAFGFTAGIFFLGYCLFEVPSNILLVRFGAGAWIARIMITWAIVSAATAFVSGAASLSIMRFCLGIAEAGFFPGIVYYLTHWIPSRDRASVISMFMTAVPISNLIGAPLSGAILDMTDGLAGLKGWQWLFLIEAATAFLLGCAAYVVLTERPEDAEWLSEEERNALTASLAEDNVSSHLTASPPTLSAALTDWRILGLSLVYFGIVAGMYGLSFWLPQIVKAFALNNTLTGVVTAIPYVFASLAMFVCGRHSDATGERIWHIAGPVFIGALALMASTQSTNPSVEIAILTVASMGIFSAMPLFWTLPTTLLRGTVAAAGIALINAIGNIGGFAGPYLIGWLKAQGLTIEASVAALAGFGLMAGVLVLAISRGYSGKVSRV
jgi:MFS family permease